MSEVIRIDKEVRDYVEARRKPGETVCQTIMRLLGVAAFQARSLAEVVRIDKETRAYLDAQRKTGETPGQTNRPRAR